MTNFFGMPGIEHRTAARRSPPARRLRVAGAEAGRRPRPSRAHVFVIAARIAWPVLSPCGPDMTMENRRRGITMAYDVARRWPFLPQPRGPRASFTA
ncbi:hypothetical protein [Burkholderia territorii]|uniref:hypothetical protein n=1 Tax=Burkholderia territorii TaxID=1503055 RepID=UPI0012DA5AB8|nr:hypothetical protein [Burkholderia territorii]